MTGTESEYKYAIKNRDRIHILTYLRKIEDICDDQLHVSRLRNLIKNQELPYQEYTTIEEFSQRIMLDILEAIIRNIIGTQISRRTQYSEFFRFGCARKVSQIISPPLIVYPPIHKHDSTGEQPTRPTYNWRERLLPNVVYEDFKTIQKIETVFRTMGINDYSSVTTLFPPARIGSGNHIWLCIPRNESAKEKLKEIGKQVRFTFITQRSKGELPEGKIIWRNTDNKEIIVNSPLTNYMIKQRPSGKRKWEPQYGYIYAKDFAIISRFKIKDRNAANDKPFYHYFIAGIRGLGTWGAGWYIDRFPDELAGISYENLGDNIQILLEVTYYNYKIIDVKNVSDKKQDYFNEQNDINHIQSQIERHCR